MCTAPLLNLWICGCILISSTKIYILDFALGAGIVTQLQGLKSVLDSELKPITSFDDFLADISDWVANAGATEADAWIYTALAALPPERYTDAKKQEYMGLLQAAKNAKETKNCLQAVASTRQ